MHLPKTAYRKKNNRVPGSRGMRNFKSEEALPNCLSTASANSYDNAHESVLYSLCYTLDKAGYYQTHKLAQLRDEKCYLIFNISIFLITKEISFCIF